MKIQMPNHSFKESEFININEMPLAYVNVNDVKLKVDVCIEKDFLTESIQSVRPYTEVVDPDVLFFSKDKQILTNIDLKRFGNTYHYEPQNLTEFTPTMFTCQALIKKNMQYQSNQDYNLKIAVIEDSNELTYAANLIKIFADAYRRGIAPPNIFVNNKSLKPESLISSALTDNDFVFAHSINGIDITDSEDKVIDVKVKDLLNSHVNVWLSVDKFDEMLIEKNITDNSTDKLAITYNEPILFNKQEYPQTAKKIYTFDTGKTNADYSSIDYTYNFISDSVLIIEKQNAGFLIVTPTFVLDNLADNATLIYEVIMNVFLKSYYLSAKDASWITDNVVDYMAYSNKKLNLKHKNIKLVKLLSNNNYEIGDNYSLLAVDTFSDKILFTGLSAYGDMVFRKTITSDPQKQDKDISYLTTKQTIVNYQEEDINLIESKLQIDTSIIDGIAYITVKPYINSFYKIHTSESQTFALTDINIQQYICTKESSPEIENTFTMVPTDEYSYDKDGFILAYITLTSEKETKTYDVRVMGGGLPVSEKDNYDMVDIGNVYGRPYRIGSTMIIRLPKIYKQYDDIIKTAINKHISSGTYPVIIYNK